MPKNLMPEHIMQELALQIPMIMKNQFRVKKIISLIITDFRKFFKFFLIPFIFLFFSCNSSEVDEEIITGEALGTSYQIKYFHDKEINIREGLDSIFRVINQSMSTYQNDSDISRINAGDSTVFVDENFQVVYNLSHKIYKESEGFFDPTVGKLVNAYGFGPETGDNELNQEEVDSLLVFVGLEKTALTPDKRISKQYPQIYLDFNAIAKGYAVDVIAQFLDKNNVQDYLLELGGELVAKGKNRSKDGPWVVGIDDPLQKEGKRELKAAVKLEDRAMATSGNYRKNRVDPATGQVYVHTINPLTGKAQKSNLLSVSVLAENCALADGYATAFMALGLERSKEMLDRLENVDVYFIYSGENKEVGTYSTSGFEKALVQE